MGVVGDIVGGVFQARAANKAADAQRDASAGAIEFARESRDLAREDLQPFRDVGADVTSQLSGLVSDPVQQKKFISDNPFFDALAGRATETILQNQAARGRVGTGSTAEALQKSMVLLGSDLLNQRVGQMQNLAGLGQASAAGQAQATQQTSQQVGGLMQDIGNASAAGQMAKANAVTGTMASMEQRAGQTAGLMAMLCDFHAKENIVKVGRMDNGLALYVFNYKGDDKNYINVMAQDVEQKYPEAIIERDGLKYVDMGVLCH